MREQPDLQRHLQHNSHVQWIPDLRLVEHLYQHADLRCCLFDLFRHHDLPVSCDLSVDVYVPRFDNLPQPDLRRHQHLSWIPDL